MPVGVIDARLPARIAAAFKGGPEWKTQMIDRANGREQRNRLWLYARYRYSANFGVFTEEDRQALIGAFQATCGRWALFRFRDPTDHFVIGEPLAPNIGTSDPVQLSRAYTFDAAISVSLLQAPVAGATSIYKDGAPVTVTVDTLTGLVTPSAPWALGTYTFDTQYDRWVRFDNDWGAFVPNSYNVWTTDIDLVEVLR